MISENFHGIKTLFSKLDHLRFFLNPIASYEASELNSLRKGRWNPILRPPRLGSSRKRR